jgi:hypothetical protein
MLAALSESIKSEAENEFEYFHAMLLKMSMQAGGNPTPTSHSRLCAHVSI